MKKRKAHSRGFFVSIRKRWLRQIWSQEKARAKRGGEIGGKKTLGKRVYRSLICPEILDIFDSENRAKTIAFLQGIRSANEKRGFGVSIDFSGLKRIFTSGALLLWAELYRATARPQNRMAVRGNRVRTPHIDIIFSEIGIYRRLGVFFQSVASDTPGHWRGATGVLSDGKPGGTLLESYEGRLHERLSKGLYGGIAEAMTNTVQHAYIGPDGDALKVGIGHRWWMISQERHGHLHVTICDLGIGIPRSLPVSKTYPLPVVDKLWNLLGGSRDDGTAIRVALELGKTRTEQRGRGKGLGEIVEAVNLSVGGEVYISSNRGVYWIRNGSVQSCAEPDSIEGTLIYWSVPVEIEKDGE